MIDGAGRGRVTARARGGLAIVPSRTERHGFLWRRPITPAQLHDRLNQAHRKQDDESIPGSNKAAALAWLAGVVRRGGREPRVRDRPRDLLDQPPFLNAARAGTPLDAAGRAGPPRARARAGARPGGRRFGPRAIDCDLLLWEGGAWHDGALEVPHPRLAERRFALLPLLDLDPGLALPDGRRLADLAAALDPADQPAARLAERSRRG